MKFRKKPVVIDADRWMPEDEKRREGVLMIPGARIAGVLLYIETLEGTMQANPGDYIIRGVKGEYYPCKPDIFEATYEPVE